MRQSEGPKAPGRSAFALDNTPKSGYTKGYFNTYDENGNIVASRSAWFKDVTNDESIRNYQVDGLTKQEVWDLVTRNRGGSLTGVNKAGPYYDAVNQKWFYYSVPTSPGAGPTIVQSIFNNGEWEQIVKYRFRR